MSDFPDVDNSGTEKERSGIEKGRSGIAFGKWDWHRPDMARHFNV